MDCTILFYSAKIKQDLEKLPETIRLKLEHYFDMIEELGPFLPMPHARPMGDGLLELRPSG